MTQIRVACASYFFFSSRRRHTRYWRDWSSDVCSSDLYFRTIAVVLLVWWLVSVLLGRPYLLPGPVAVGTEALELAASGELFNAVVVSGERLLVAYSLAVAVGVPLGIAMGRIWFVNDLFDWLIEMVRPISG